MSNDSSKPKKGQGAAHVPGELTPTDAAPGKTWQDSPWGPLAGVFYGVFVAFLGGQVAVGILLGILLMMFGMPSGTIDPWFRTPFGVFVSSVLGAGAVFALIHLFLRSRRASVKQLGLDTFRRSYVATAIGAFVVYFVAYLIIVSVVKLAIPSLDLNQEQDLGMNNPQGIIELVMAFVILVVLPPLVEEVIFRGFLYTGLRKKLTFLPAAILTSLLFAAGHLEIGNNTPLLWIAAIDTFTISMVMCFVRERTGSIWPTIVLHAIKNGLAFTFLFIIVS